LIQPFKSLEDKHIDTHTEQDDINLFLLFKNRRSRLKEEKRQEAGKVKQMRK
jgi:hypothetical protein